MSKVIVVCTTRWINSVRNAAAAASDDNIKGGLFDNNPTGISIVDNKSYVPLVDFWGDRVGRYIIDRKSDDIFLNHCDVYVDQAKREVAQKGRAIDDDIIKRFVNRYIEKDDIPAANYEKIYRSTDIRINNREIFYADYDKVYSLKDNSDVYALYHLPKVYADYLFADDSVNDIKQKWIDALVKSFMLGQSDTTLYLVVHGSTDVPEVKDGDDTSARSAFSLLPKLTESVKENNKELFGNNNELQIAAFQHDNNSDRFSALLSQSSSGEQFSADVQQLFVKLKNEGYASLIYDQLRSMDYDEKKVRDYYNNIVFDDNTLFPSVDEFLALDGVGKANIVRKIRKH